MSASSPARAELSRSVIRAWAAVRVVHARVQAYPSQWAAAAVAARSCGSWVIAATSSPAWPGGPGAQRVRDVLLLVAQVRQQVRAQPLQRPGEPLPHLRLVPLAERLRGRADVVEQARNTGMIGF